MTAFAQLDTDVQVARLARLAARALAAWDLDAPRVTLVKYRENAVFGVTEADGRRAVLRVHRPRYRSDTDIRSEIAWMRALDAAGVPTPAVLETRAGDVLVVVEADGVPEPRQCDLMAWVPGASPGSLERGVADTEAGVGALYRGVGALAARMHAHGAAWSKPAGFTRPAWDVATLVGEAPTFGPFWELDGLTAEQRTVLLAARDRARERLAAWRPADALIHGDLVPDNLLVDGDATRVIDFDDCGWSWVAFELVTSLFPLQVSGGFDAGLAGFLEGYRSVRPFPDEELVMLPDLLVARGLSYLGWPVGRPEIASVRPLVPVMAAMMADAAARYVAA